jgi:hypothetical protein
MSLHFGDRTPTAAGEFSDRIMAAIARESTPTPARAFVSAVRARSADDAVSALWVAWHLATVRRWWIAPGVRARSIALVMAVVCALGTGSLTAAAALSVAAEPVVQFFQSSVNEHGQVEDNPLGADQLRSVQKTQPSAEEQGSEGVENDQSGTSEPSGDDVDDNQPDADESGPEVDDDNESGDDEPNDSDDVESGQSGDDESADEDADRTPSASDEPADEDADDDQSGDEPAEADHGDDSDAEPPGGDEQGGDDEDSEVDSSG